MRAADYYGYHVHLLIASAIYHVDILVYRSRIGRGFRLFERYVPRAWASAARCCVGAPWRCPPLPTNLPQQVR